MQRILITGVSSGLGRALARAALAKGPGAAGAVRNDAHAAAESAEERMTWERVSRSTSHA